MDINDCWDCEEPVASREAQEMKRTRRWFFAGGSRIVNVNGCWNCEEPAGGSQW